VKFNINIPNHANDLIHMLQSHGHAAYIVGGCVRDSILGRTPNDWDICTSATPSEMLNIFNDKRIIETGLQHGTLTVVVGDESYEVTTFRIDGDYSDNRRPDTVTFTSNLEEDLSRRDFTINAIAYNDEEGLIDPFGGLDDIKDMKIRCVGNANDRFQEDALRVLRALRFSCQMDFEIEEHTKYAIISNAQLLKNISKERVNSELCKMVICNRFPFVLRLYVGVFCQIIPEMCDIVDFQQNNPYHDYDVFTHTAKALSYDESCDLTTRLAILFHDFGKPHCYQDDEDGTRHFKGHGRVSAEIADAIMLGLRFDNKTRHDVAGLVHYHDATFEVGRKYIKRWLNKIGEEQFRRLLNVRRADIKGQKKEYGAERIEKVDVIEQLLEDVLQEGECFSAKDLAINGNDLISIGYETGKKLGHTLSTLLQMVIDGEIQNEHNVLLQAAAKMG